MTMRVLLFRLLVTESKNKNHVASEFVTLRVEFFPFGKKLVS